MPGLVSKHITYIGCLAGVIALSACATVATATLDNRLQALGLPEGTADCMATDLNENLSREDVIDLTQYTFTLSRVDTPVAAVRALMNIDNPRAVTAVGKAGFKCVRTGFLG